MFIFYGSAGLMGLSLFHVEVSRSHSVIHTPSVGLLWTSDHPVAETSVFPTTHDTHKRHPCLRRDSNPQS